MKKFLVLFLALLLLLVSCSAPEKEPESFPEESSFENASSEEIKVFCDSETKRYRIKNGETVIVEAVYSEITDCWPVFVAEKCEGSRQDIAYNENQSPIIKNMPNKLYWIFGKENGEKLIDMAFESVGFSDASEDINGIPYIYGCSDGSYYVYNLDETGKAVLVEKDEPSEEKLENGYNLFSRFWRSWQGKWE